MCSSLREELGEALLTSVYVEDEDRLWLSAQRGYHQVVHTHSLGAGLFARAYEGGPSIAVEQSVSADPRYIEVVRGIESLAAARFDADVTGVVGIESRERLAESDGRAIVESAARAIEHALERLSARGHLRGSGRLRLLRAVSALAACHEPLAIVELLARSVGDALGLDLVQVALVQNGRLVPRVVWSRSSDRSLRLDARRFRAQAERFAHELVLGSEDGIASVVGVPLRAGGELVGYLIGGVDRDGERGRGAHRRGAGRGNDRRAGARGPRPRAGAARVAGRPPCLQGVAGAPDRVGCRARLLSRARRRRRPARGRGTRIPRARARPRARRGRRACGSLARRDPSGRSPSASSRRSRTRSAAVPSISSIASSVPGGTCRTYRLRGRFRRDDGRVLFDAMVADVTERRRAELRSRARRAALPRGRRVAQRGPDRARAGRSHRVGQRERAAHPRPHGGGDARAARRRALVVRRCLRQPDRAARQAGRT